jgi:hypothetical protein
MRYWYDCEFIEDGRTIDLISIGMIAEDGRELYLVDERLADTLATDGLYDRVRRHPWLMQHVVPHLPLKCVSSDSGYAIPGGQSLPWFRIDTDSNVVVPRRYIRNAVRDFIAAAGPDRGAHELWAYYGAYDHVALCQLWGRMIDLPGCVPMWTHELMQLPDVEAATAAVAQQQEHHALADARWNRDVHLKWEEINGG